MGVKTPITLHTARALFKGYEFVQLAPTTQGVIDTTYKIYTPSQGYILKKYERDIAEQIEQDAALLDTLSQAGLYVSRRLAKNGDWHLYEMLEGTPPQHITPAIIQALSRTIAHFHSLHVTLPVTQPFLENYPLGKYLRNIKSKHFKHYKTLNSLQHFKMECEGFIHGDIFKDNTLYAQNKLAIIDFIDGGCGSFAFDAGVALLSFNPKNKPLLNTLFIRTYNNHHRHKKLTHKELQQMRRYAAKLYALLRINHYGSTSKANLLLF